MMTEKNIQGAIMKRRGMFLKSVIAIFIVLAVSVSCGTQKAKTQLQDQPGGQSSEQSQEQSRNQVTDPAKDEPKGQRQWKIYMGTETRRYYFDPASIQKLDKRIVRVWERITEPDKDGEEMEKVESLLELDCGSSRYRIVASREYDSARPGEKPVVRMENGPWTYFNLETILGILYDNVCFPSTTPPGAAPKVLEKPKGPPTFKR
jgi:hypothetical protein